METNYVLIWLALIVCGFLAWFFNHRAKHKERLMMIERGLNVNENSQKEKELRLPWMRLGILIIGLSIGLLIIALLDGYGLINKGHLPIGILGACGGISIVIANYISRGKNKG